jgi:geranylgeranyl transferase type-2 subunit beta
MSYLGDLTIRLAGGAMRLEEDFRRRQADYFLADQRDDGGFAGRQGASDLYYSGFALRGLALLGMLEAPTARRAAEFLQTRLDSAPSLVDFLSLVQSAVLLEMIAEIDLFADAGRDRRTMLADAVAPYRCADAGFAKTAGGHHSSTYYTLLVSLSGELAGMPIVDRQQIAELVRSRQRDDGGFVELAPLRSSGTNPTAAAVSLLRLLDALDEPTAGGATDFLVRMQNVEGGLRANASIPIADLLSTFTGLVALDDLGAAERIDRDAARAFAHSLQQPEGGFRAGAWDDAADVEYTFYGLGTLALLGTS